MPFAITRIVIGEPRSIDIAESEFVKAVSAQDNLTTILGIEQKFDLLLSSYVEYEEELLRQALHHLVWIGDTGDALRDGWPTINRRVFNVLAAARLYLDQIKVDLSAMFEKTSAVYVELDEFIRSQYDSELAYRAMEGLRNHSQHRSLPVGKLHYPARIERDTDPPHVSYSAFPSLNLDDLRQHGSIKKSILDELSELSESPNLTALIRKYLDCLGNVHARLRTLTDSHVTNWEATINALRDRAQEVFGNELVGLGIVERDVAGFTERKRYLLDETILDRQRLRKKSGIVIHFATRYVTGALDLGNV